MCVQSVRPWEGGMQRFPTLISCRFVIGMAAAHRVIQWQHTSCCREDSKHSPQVSLTYIGVKKDQFIIALLSRFRINGEM